MISRALDRLVSVVSPRWAVERIYARATLTQIEKVTGGKGGYDAGRLNRLTKGRLGSSLRETEIPGEEIARLRWQAWDLFRNNPYARKIVRAILSQTIGRGLRPTSTATRQDGTPHFEFRARAAQLWKAIQRGFDFRGLPGQGGLTFTQLQRLALQSVILGGEVLSQPRPLSTAEQKRRNLPIPLSLQLIDASRLGCITQVGDHIYRGIELDDDNRRVAYHIADTQPGQPWVSTAIERRIPADRIIHLFVEEDVDQLRGVSWFAPALLQARDTGDYQYNELKASAMAACIVLGFRSSTGRKFGLAPGANEEENDEDGNRQTFLQPGMMVDLGKDGAMDAFNPARPGANAEGFIKHMLRGIAAAFPGLKASTVTGDYRGSSFSSERSADNDAWPELESLQDWFACHQCQPIWEAVLTAGILTGWFDGIVSAGEFLDNRAAFLGAEWQGPVARSINPKDDADSAGLRISKCLSSPQIEAAAVGRNWVDILRDVAEFREHAITLGLPEEFVNNVLSVDAQDVTDPAGAPPKAENADGEPPELPDEQDDEEDQTPANEKEGAHATSDA